MIQVIKKLAATTADILAGTDLENIPASAGVLQNGCCGQLDVFCASTQADHTLNVRKPGGETVLAAQLIQQRTNAVISLADDLPISVPASPGRMVVDLTVVTAGNDNLIFVYRDLADLGIV